MKIEELLIESESEGERIDKFLADYYENLSRAIIQKQISKGLILVNDKAVKSNYRLVDGDCLKIDLPESQEIVILPEKMDLDIIYEDEDILVVNKEKGIVVHPALGNYQGSLVNGLLAHTENLSAVNGLLRPGIVHRLDKDTSGLLLVCKNDQTHLAIAQQFKDQTVERSYYALVKGLINEPAGRIEAPLGRSSKDRKKMEVTFKNSKEAITNYKVLERFPQGYTLLECSLETGRTHQIRVHLAWLGYPVIGDKTYGPRKSDFPEIEGQLLQAYRLGFFHPGKEEKMVFEIAFSDEIEKTIEKFREE